MHASVTASIEALPSLGQRKLPTAEGIEGLLRCEEASAKTCMDKGLHARPACTRIHRTAHVEREEVREEAAPLGRAQEGWRKGGAQEQALQVADAGVRKVQQVQRAPHARAALHVRSPACAHSVHRLIRHPESTAKGDINH